MNKTLKKLLGVLGLFLVLLSALLLAERNAPEAGIRSFPAALWFALTTLTTVGYGDLYPVTGLGRVIGAVLQLGSLGLLAFLIGSLLLLYRGRLRPMSRLWLRRGQDWYIFASAEARSRALAGALLAEDPRRTVIFSSPGEETELPGISAELSPAELLRFRGRGEGAHLFFLSEDVSRNEQGAADLTGSGCRTYCLSPNRPDKLPEGQLRFDPWEICARLYWQRFPILRERERIWIVGDGRYARALLEQALLVNLVAPAQQICYTLCGDFADFRRLHPALESLTAPEGTGETGDRLIYWDRAWDSDPEALCAADRIIFCSDREEETQERLTDLLRYFPVTGQVHARLSRPCDGAETFGSLRELYTPELVMRARLDWMAAALHNIYRAANGGPAWEELGDFARRSNLAAADHLAVKIRLLLPGEAAREPDAPLCRRAGLVYETKGEEERRRFREIEHLRWERFHLLHNWRWGPKRDNRLRIHPLLLPFDRLSAQEQAKDDYAWELLNEVGRERTENER